MANEIPYWGSFTVGSHYDWNPAETVPGQQFLEGIRQYDPNATFVKTGGSSDSSPYWELQADVSKIPGYGNVRDINPQAYAPLNLGPNDSGYTWDQYLNTGGGGYKFDLLDPNAVRDEPVLGQVTDVSNTVDQKGSPMEIWGPLGVLGFGFAMGGIPGLWDGLGSQFTTGAVDAGAANPAWGMADRGLGVAGGAGADGTLSAADIAGLGNGSTYGMYDRGLGTATGTEAGTTGVLSADEIAALGPGSGSSFLDRVTNLLKDPGTLAKIPGLLAGGNGSGGGLPGFSIGGGGGGGGGAESAVSILRKFYADDPNLRGLLAQKGLV